MADATEAPPLSPYESALAVRVNAALPQTQCTKCGFTGCRPYAEAIALGQADINQCPPGGAAGIAKLSAITGRPALPLNPANGVEVPLRIAVIDEALCIGCTLCIQACPVDAIAGAGRRMHTVLPALCTGCDLCVPPCPMDCITVVVAQPPRAWNDDDARAARTRFEARARRMLRERVETEERRLVKAVAKLGQLDSGLHDDDPLLEGKKARVGAAIERARARRRPPATDAGTALPEETGR
jgi:Na+-translocating ferredoxin:NAD+ oxidoreductase subunit B